MIKGKNQKHVEDIIGELHRLGAMIPEAEDAVFEEAPKDKVVPKGFYSTTNHTTYVKVDGEWRAGARPEDGCHDRRERRRCAPASR